MNFDVIIIGGSYAGLSAAMALGRSLRKVLIIDSNDPCNKTAQHAHNILTHDGRPPHEIASMARADVLLYDSVSFLSATAEKFSRVNGSFEITVNDNRKFTAKKVLFATGLKDFLPEIPGLSDCWGKSVVHCPYCHGYEFRGKQTGILANDETGDELTRLIYQWSTNLTLITNEKSSLTDAQHAVVRNRGVQVIDKKINRLIHTNGMVSQVQFEDGSRLALDVLYTRPRSVQQCALIEKIGCRINDFGLVEIDDFHRTSIPGIYAAGDNSCPLRSLSVAIASGTKAGAFINKHLIDEQGVD